MKAIEKIRSISYHNLKNYFFINFLRISDDNNKINISGFDNGAEENCSLDFEEYKDAYTARCRWS